MDYDGLSRSDGLVERNQLLLPVGNGPVRSVIRETDGVIRETASPSGWRRSALGGFASFDQRLVLIAFSGRARTSDHGVEPFSHEGDYPRHLYRSGGLTQISDPAPTPRPSASGEVILGARFAGPTRTWLLIGNSQELQVHASSQIIRINDPITARFPKPPTDRVFLVAVQLERHRPSFRRCRARSLFNRRVKSTRPTSSVRIARSLEPRIHTEIAHADYRDRFVTLRKLDASCLPGAVAENVVSAFDEGNEDILTRAAR